MAKPPKSIVLLELNNLAASCEEQAANLSLTTPGSVHDARVQLRKLHSVLESLAPFLESSGRVSRAIRKAKKLHLALQKVRDLEVMLEHLQANSQTQSAATALLMVKIRTRLFKALEAEKTIVQVKVDSGKLEFDAAALRASIAKLKLKETGSKTDPAILVLLAKRQASLVKALSKLDLTADRIGQIHAMRIELKQFRYLSEFAAHIDASVIDKAQNRQLKVAQEGFGVLHDYEVLKSWLAKPKNSSPKLEPILAILIHRIDRRSKQLESKLTGLTW